MNKPILLPVLLGISAILSIAACRSTAVHNQAADARARIDHKAEPFDQFTFQRSYPDTTFNVVGWRRRLQSVRLNEQVAERSGNPCVGYNASWTLQGPANVAGRTNAIAIHPNNDDILLAGFAGGGIFKSIDGGANWHPVFDEQPELSIGDITYDPQNPDIVYAGTGDPNMPIVLFNGEGIYKSTDGGDTWNYLGLAGGGVISKVLVDPQNSQVLYAATMGNPYVRSNERGVYKSTNGGITWQKVLFVSNQAGASDLVMHTSQPQVLYASFWDRIRSNTESMVYGPHARVYKSTDGGATWNQLGGGLPTGIWGRTGLVISATNPNKLYAVYVDSLSRPGGLYKTTDGGQTWTSMNVTGLSNAYGNFGWFFGKLRLNPLNDEELYFLGILLWRRDPQSGSFGVGAGAHADTHDLVFGSTGRRYLATDGGVYRNNPGQMIWTKCLNLPTTQFYRTNYNPHLPNTYFAGAQDNGIQKGNGANINGWTAIFPADGFRSAFNPNDANNFWIEIQNGSIYRTSDGGLNFDGGATAFGTSDRCNWDAPFFQSVHPPHFLYAGTYRVYSSPDGTGWGPFSGDLTDGLVYEPRFHTISALNESPVTAGKMLAGTSDGNLWRKDPSGNWTNISSGLPNRYVTSVHGSTVLTNRIFITQSGFRDDEYVPHIHRSDNNGTSWTDISGDLPQLPVNDLLILPGHADSVLFAATDGGVYATTDGGQNWGRLGDNMPYIPAFDLEHNPVRKELVAATFARGLWTYPIDSVFVQSQGGVLVAQQGLIQTAEMLGVDNVEVDPGVYSDTSGQFILNGLSPCTTHTITPYRNDDHLLGVSTFDLVLINKHILDIEPFNTPYKSIAADANRSKTVTTFDIAVIRKLILGIDNTFQNTTSWRFVPKDYVFPNPDNPFTPQFPESLTFNPTGSLPDVRFVAIKTGDVNASAVPLQGEMTDDRDDNPWPLVYSDVEVPRGDTVDFVLYPRDNMPAGIQFTLQFDPEAMQLMGLVTVGNGGPTDENMGLQGLDRGFITFCYEPSEAILSPVLHLTFKALRDVKLSEQVRLGDVPTRAVAYGADGRAGLPVLMPSTEVSGATTVWPNPFGTSGVNLQWTAGLQAAQLQLHDASGRLVYETNIGGTVNLLYLPSGLFASPGTYTYTIKHAKGSFQGKLVYVP